MTKVIISNQKRQQIAELQFASNITWRKALDAFGFASFDLPLSDPFATPTYLNAGNYVHIFNDSVSDTSVYANADFGGVFTNDFEIKPHQGIVTIAAAGLGQLLDVSITTTTQSYSNLDVGTIINSLVTTCDNFPKLGLTQLTVDTGGAFVNSYVAGFGDQVWTKVVELAKKYGGDFEVRPDFSYAYYIRQGQDNPNLIVRYGNQGNIQVETSMHLVNTELANKVYNIGQDGTVSATVTNQTSAIFFGPKTVVIQDGDTYIVQDALTKAQLEVTKRAFPQTMMDNVVVVNTPLLPFNKINLGDRVLFEAPSLPFLQQFNGLQTILAVEYDDTKRTMSLTLGNALYTVLRGKLHEVRLFTSQ